MQLVHFTLITFYLGCVRAVTYYQDQLEEADRYQYWHPPAASQNQVDAQPLTFYSPKGQVLERTTELGGKYYSSSIRDPLLSFIAEKPLAILFALVRFENCWTLQRSFTLKPLIIVPVL